MKQLLIVAMVLCFALPVGAQLRTGVRRQQGLPRPATNPPTTPAAPGQNMPGLPPENVKWNTSGSVIDDDFRSDVFAAPTLKFTTLSDQFGFLAGLRAGWIINRRYVIGLAGYGLVNDVPGPEIEYGLRPDLAIKYGGGELEYIINPKHTVHFSISTLVGLGYVRYDFTDTTKNDDDTFLIVEPSLTVYFNLTDNLQTGIGLSYRMTPTDVNLGDLGNPDLTGLTGTITFSFGTYGTTLVPD